MMPTIISGKTAVIRQVERPGQVSSSGSRMAAPRQAKPDTKVELEEELTGRLKQWVQAKDVDGSTVSGEVIWETPTFIELQIGPHHNIVLTQKDVTITPATPPKGREVLMGRATR